MAESEAGVTYSYLNDDIVNEFKGAGTENLIQLLGTSDNSSNIDELIGTVFTELIMVLEDGKLDAQTIIDFLSNCIRDEEMAVRFCQILNIFPLSEEIKTLINLLHENETVIRHSTLARFLAPETLGALNIVPQDVLTRQLHTKRRDEYYTQKKFNLLHEEAEGFARITVEIMNILRNPNSEFQVSYALKTVENLIGHYNLDPNKTFDIIFECFSNCLTGNVKFIVNFLKSSRWWPETPSNNSSLDSLCEGGDEDLVKLVGLKFLKSPPERPFPETFKLFVSILIKIGFISLGSLYKYIFSDPLAMEEIEKLYKKRLDEEIFKSSANALALAAPLMDDEEEGGDEAKPKTKLNEKDEKLSTEELFKQKINCNSGFQMLKSFLSIGLYWPSVYILTEFPFLALIDDEVGTLICRIYHHMIEPLYEKTATFNSNELKELLTSKKVSLPTTNNEVYYEDFKCKTLLSFKATLNDTSQKKFVFFYEDWKTDLPTISTTSQLIDACRGLLKFLNVTFAKDIQLYTKICDIVLYEVSQTGPTEEWFLFYRNVIFPAISILEYNSIVVDKAYLILALYPKESRFNLYSEFHQVTSKNNPYIKISYGKAEKSTKDVLKRLSKETVRPMMRRIAKISFANPLPCFLTVLQQIESYDNLNSLVVETARYFNDYGWDVLSLAIMMRVTASGRSSVQTNGLFERQWIQSLASFVGKICHRYPNSVDISTLLEFILKSLHNNDTGVLTIFKEMLLSMGGLTSINNLTLDQIDNLNSGESLKRMVFTTIRDTRYECMKSGTILLKNLVSLNCVNELLVLLFQISENITYEDDSDHLKIIANRKDELVVVMQLFCDLINFFAIKDQFDLKLVAVPELITKYNLPPEWTFEVWRTFLGDNNEQGIEVGVDMSQKLFDSFWSKSLYDIGYLESLYESALKKNDAAVKELEISHEKLKKSRAPSHQINELAEKLEKAKDLSEKISSDKESHFTKFETVQKNLKEEASTWFTTGNLDQIDSFFQYCIMPRAVHSSFDAVFCAKFLFLFFNFTEEKVPAFSLLDRLMTSDILLGTLFTSTLIESENLGVFFSQILVLLNDWDDEENFSKLGIKDSLGEVITFKSYKQKMYLYHVKLLEDLLRSIRSKDYMCRRNGVIFLKNIVRLFPVIEDQCEQFVELIEKIIDTEDREDLKLSANALIGHLKSRKSSWVHLWDFVELPEDEAESHKQKRQEIAKRIEKEEQDRKEKQKKEREEREKVEKEKLDKLKREREAEAVKNREKQKLSYLDSGSSTPSAEGKLRTAGRNEGGTKRDYYSQYEKLTHNGKDEPINIAQDKKGTEPDNKRPKASEHKGQPETSKELSKRPPAVETSSTNRTNDSTASTSRGPTNGKRSDDRSLYVPSQTKAATLETKEKPKQREPLPPQLSLLKDYPSRMPQTSSYNNGGGRGYQGFENRKPGPTYDNRKPSGPAYDKRPVGPTYDNRKPSTPTFDNRKSLNADVRKPVGPSSFNRKPTGPRQATGPLRPTSQNRDPLPPPRSSNQNPSPLPPPPPPPAAPGSGNGRYDNKRKAPYQDGRYDKRQRY